MSESRAGSLEYRIAQLETQLTRFGLSPAARLQEGFSTGSCTNNCTAACTIGCTSGCTGGCAAQAEAVAQPQVTAQPAAGGARAREALDTYQRLSSDQQTGSSGS